MLCANCHRTIHKKGAPKSVAQLSVLPGVAKLGPTSSRLPRSSLQSRSHQKRVRAESSGMSLLTAHGLAALMGLSFGSADRMPTAL